MPSSPLVGEWTITSWTPDSNQVPDGIPTDGFLVGGPLNITQPDPNVNSFNLQWTDQEEQTSSVSGLQSVSGFPFPTLAGEDLLVSFGTTNVSCDLTLSLNDQGLTGSIGVAGSSTAKEGPDTGSGTFTAEANP